MTMLNSSTNAPAPFVVMTKAGSSATITLRRPKLNPINDEVLNQLDGALARLEADPNLTAVRIKSDQSAFSAGADLAMVKGRLGSDAGAVEMTETTRLFHRVYNRLASLPAVTVAEIAGHALGGGLELALACDLRIAAREAKLGLPEARMGLLPGAGGTQRLTELCGPGVAARLILTCELISGTEAERLGIVQWAYDAKDLEAATDQLMARIEKLSAPALRIAKRCIGHAAAISEEGAMAEIDGIGALIKTSDAEWRVSEFLNG